MLKLLEAQPKHVLYLQDFETFDTETTKEQEKPQSEVRRNLDFHQHSEFVLVWTTFVLGALGETALRCLLVQSVYFHRRGRDGCGLP